jgi:hypothetical protein
LFRLNNGQPIKNFAKNSLQLSAAQNSGICPKNPLAKKPYSVFLPTRACSECWTHEKTLVGLDSGSLRVITSHYEISNGKSMRKVASYDIRA